MAAVEVMASINKAETKSILYDQKTQKLKVNAETLKNILLTDDHSKMSSRRSDRGRKTSVFNKTSIVSILNKGDQFISPLISNLNKEINKNLDRRTLKSVTSNSMNGVKSKRAQSVQKLRSHPLINFRTNLLTGSQKQSFTYRKL